MNWQKIETRPSDREFLAWDPIARKADVCVSDIVDVYGFLDICPSGKPYSTRRGKTGERLSCRSTQSDGQFEPLPDEFQEDRATLWCDIEPPIDED